MSKKKKLTTEEIMERIIDIDSLEKRKTTSKNKKEVSEFKIEIKKNDIKVEKKWFQKPMIKENFEIKEYENKWFARYNEWKEHIWIGAYESEKELIDVVKSYIKETKKPPMERNIKNIHSILIDIW